MKILDSKQVNNKMRRNFSRDVKGFSLIELIVVIGVISIMLSVVFFGISEAQQNGRDKKRVGDLSQIEFALTIYKNAHRDYPEYDDGIEIGVGAAIDEILQPLMGTMVHDPKASETFSYYYDSSFICSEDNQAVIFIKTMEQTKNANYEEICTDADADGVANQDSYVVILDQ